MTRDDLKRIRILEADRRGSRVLTITEGERLSLTAALAYRNGWILREVNERGETIAAYCKDA